MRFAVLGSGSRGNSTYVERNGQKILIDAGFSGLEVERRLAVIGVDPSSIGAILVTHEHGDHIKGVQVLSRRFNIPVFISPETLAASGKTLARLELIEEIYAGEDFELGGLHIHPFSLSHDAVDPLGFVIKAQEAVLGYCTDTGHISKMIRHRLAGCNGLIIECNHDPGMLKNGSYPPHLIQRISSRFGHLTNAEVAAFILSLKHDGLRYVVLAHLSESNNTPELALREVEGLIGQRPGFKVLVAEQDTVGALMRLGEPQVPPVGSN